MRFALPLLLVLASAPASAQFPASPSHDLTGIVQLHTNASRPASPFGGVAPARCEEAVARPAKPNSAALAAAVGEQAEPSQLPRELACLAGAIYFEAKTESLSGQLAVGRVVVARARSGRFPSSYCGVVFQRGQFSFVRGRTMPPIDRNSRDWREAIAVARIADSGRMPSGAEGALFFHAASVSPGWNRKRVARIEHHIFYR